MGVFANGGPRFRTSTMGGHSREVDSDPLPEGGRGSDFADTGAGREGPLETSITAGFLPSCRFSP